MAARIYGILAPKANKVVLLRRGPSRLTLQLVWDLETDKFTCGQWIRAHVFCRRCDVSPDGRYLVGAFSDYKQRRKVTLSERTNAEAMRVWTAINRPPYYTALALWFSCGSYNNGGIWESKTSVGLNNFYGSWEESKPVSGPVDARNLNLDTGEDEPLYSLLLRKRGWADVDSRIIARKWNLGMGGWKEELEEFLLSSGSDSPILRAAVDREGSKPRVLHLARWERRAGKGLLRRLVCGWDEVWQLINSDGEIMREWSDDQEPSWLELDGKGRLIYGEHGCLWRWEDFPNEAPEMVADLNDLTFEEVPPPAWALKW